MRYLPLIIRHSSFVILHSLLLAAPLPDSDLHNGAIKATISLRPDGTRSTRVVNPDKRTAEETINTEQGKFLRRTLYLLGTGDLPTGAIFYDQRNQIRYREAYKRDAAGQIIESKFYSRDKKYLGRRAFFYDGKGNVTQRQDFDAVGNLIQTTGGKKR